MKNDFMFEYKCLEGDINTAFKSTNPTGAPDVTIQSAWNPNSAAAASAGGGNANANASAAGVGVGWSGGVAASATAVQQPGVSK